MAIDWPAFSFFSHKRADMARYLLWSLGRN